MHCGLWRLDTDTIGRQLIYLLLSRGVPRTKKPRGAFSNCVDEMVSEAKKKRPKVTNQRCYVVTIFCYFLNIIYTLV
jgi:hypothetical protein